MLSLRRFPLAHSCSKMIFAVAAASALLFAGSAAASGGSYGSAPGSYGSAPCVSWGGQSFCFSKTYTVDREVDNDFNTDIEADADIMGNTAVSEADAQALGDNTFTDAQAWTFTAQSYGPFPGTSVSGATSASGSSDGYY